MEDTRSERLDPSELETHRAWLQRLAVVILRDADRAEDCVQDVFLTALRGGPVQIGASASLRAWLKRVLVNRARRSIDREARRRYHEALALAEHPRGSGREPLELRELHAEQRAELHAELQSGVLALEPRYREVVLLRHEHGLLPGEIAARLGVPLKTVNSWLYRAYGKLRERLDARRTSLPGWLALVRLAGTEGAADSLAGAQRREREHVHARPSRLLRWSIAGLVASGAAILFLAWQRPDVRVARAQPGPAPVEIAAARPVLAPPPAETERTPLSGAALEPAPAPPAASAPRVWSGRVLDADGAPVAGVRLRFEPLTQSDVLLFSDRASAGFEELVQRMGKSFEPELDAHDTRNAARNDAPEALSAADGSFALRAPERAGWIAVADGSWSTVATSVTLVLPPVEDALVRVARPRHLAGRVHDENGRPLASVRVELRLPERFLAAETGPPTRIAHEPCTFSADDGTFAFERVPEVADATLRFRANGYEPVDRRLGACRTTRARAEIEVELRAEAPGLVLTGRTLDAHGAPVAGAFVSFDWTSTATSDEQGRFRLRLAEARAAAGATRGGFLRAAALGFQPLVRPVRSEGAAWPATELVFEDEALELRGVVLRADGTPHPNAAVWMPAPAPLGLPPGDRAPIFMEHVMGGVQHGGSLQATTTEADGSFRLLGLQERAYVLRVADLETREWFETEPIDAGLDDLRLCFPPDGTYPEVRGRIVARDGAPVAGVRISRSYPRLDAPLPDGRRFRSSFAGEPVEADADGRFVLTNVARRQGLLTVFGPSIYSLQVELEHERDPTELRLVVGRSCHVVVERGGLDCDRFTFRADGGAVEFMPAVRGASATLSQAPLADERSAEYVVTDLATELVLWSGAREVTRLALALDPHQLNVLRP